VSPRVTAVGEQTSLAWRKERAGQRMVIGFQGTSVNDDLRRVVAEIKPAGFVLFARNVEEPAQVRELNRELTSLCDASTPPFLAVDQEGGRVQRIKAPATVWPPMRSVGLASGFTEAISTAIAVELRAMGFNLNFAPVTDVDSNPDNPIIGDRAFSADPDQVAALVQIFIQAHQKEGLIACAKHFPGHGDTHVDSHLDLPWVDRDDRGLRRLELTPFRAAVVAGVATLMTSHVMYPAWDEHYPATLSKRIQKEILRDELGFQGLLFSDDLEMAAIAGRYSIEEQVAKMTEATVDVFLCCESHTLQLEVFREQMLLQERSESAEFAAEVSAKRAHRLREQFFVKRAIIDDSIWGCPAHLALAAEVVRRANDKK
jgi:beta-N-acetylhexosaminidase